VRLVLDTNTAISGLLWGGTPGRLIDAAAAGKVELVASAALLVELQGVLSRPKFAGRLAQRRVTVGDLFDGYASLVSIVKPAAIAPTILSDPADDQVLAAALGAQAELIVSGDAHVLQIRTFASIDIVTAAAAAGRLSLV
jgi:putative PIN family toxin of toxin-antitoxin system